MNFNQGKFNFVSQTCMPFLLSYILNIAAQYSTLSTVNGDLTTLSLVMPLSDKYPKGGSVNLYLPRQY
jgi:hypothetical protein